jgi:hypothetical protein
MEIENPPPEKERKRGNEDNAKEDAKDDQNEKEDDANDEDEEPVNLRASFLCIIFV